MFQRQATHDILEGARSFPVVAILGPRQAGKTTLAKRIFKQHTYLSLEDWDIRAAAIQDPRTFLKAHHNKHGLIIDEFQYAPELLSYIQTITDNEQIPGYFILTGSQNILTTTEECLLFIFGVIKLDMKLIASSQKDKS